VGLREGDCEFRWDSYGKVEISWGLVDVNWEKGDCEGVVSPDLREFKDGRGRGKCDGILRVK
jgi:hypothetical protein